MIVVDTNVILHFWLPGEFQPLAQKLIKLDPNWITVPLWRSEMRNVLKNYFKAGLISREMVYNVIISAEGQMGENEIPVTSKEVLDITLNHNCSAYDAEFVALSKKLSFSLISCDKKLAKEFPKEVSELRKYVNAAI